VRAGSKAKSKEECKNDRCEKTTPFLWEQAMLLLNLSLPKTALIRPQNQSNQGSR